MVLAEFQGSIDKILEQSRAMDLRELWSSGGEKHPSKKGPNCQQNNHETCQL